MDLKLIGVAFDLDLKLIGVAFDLPWKACTTTTSFHLYTNMPLFLQGTCITLPSTSLKVVKL
jgi:hypothetical protein